MDKTQDGKHSAFPKEDYERLASFRYLLRQFFGFSERAAQEHGVTPQQYQAMLAVRGFPGRDYITIGELAEQLQIRHHSAVELVDRLVEQELAVRQGSESDRRVVHVVLTDNGYALLEKLAYAHREQLSRLAPEMMERLGSLSGGRDAGR
jgi:DNA-binding MarR family transcriptional regulator